MGTPRVTEVLRAYTSYEHVPREILDKAAARGSSTHALCAAIAKGGWIPDSMVPEELQGYVTSFKEWSLAQVREFIIVEKRYTDTVADYSGQVDFVVRGNDGELYLVDLKTSAKPQRTYPVQMAAYDRLLQRHDIHVKGAMLVYLDKFGQFPDIDYLEGMIKEYHIFLAALDCWHYFNKKRERHERPRHPHPEHISESASSDGGSGLHREGFE